MNNHGPDCLQFYRDKGIILPGSDLTRTVGFFLSVLIMITLTKESPVVRLDFDQLRPYKDVTFLVLIFCLAIIALNFYWYDKLGNINIGKVISYRQLFFGRIAILFALGLFYFIICLWVMLLGGIMNSPFTSMLTISPIITLVHVYQDYNSNYYEIIDAANKHASIPESKIISPNDSKYRNRITILNLIPLIFALLTITIGEYFVTTHDLSIILLNSSYKEILASDDYCTIYYIIFGISFSIAVFGSFPELTRYIARKFETAVLGGN